MPDVDMGDILKIANSDGKRLFKTSENVRIIDLIQRPYGRAPLVKTMPVGLFGEHKTIIFVLGVIFSRSSSISK